MTLMQKAKLSAFLGLLLTAYVILDVEFFNKPLALAIASLLVAIVILLITIIMLLLHISEKLTPKT